MTIETNDKFIDENGESLVPQTCERGLLLLLPVWVITTKAGVFVTTTSRILNFILRPYLSHMWDGSVFVYEGNYGDGLFAYFFNDKYQD